MGYAASQQRISGVDEGHLPPGTGYPGLMRDAIYWIHEGVGFAMTKQPRLLKIGELLGKWNINRSIKDPELRRKLTPNYVAGCKRILNSDTYYRGIANPKTQVFTEGIERMTADGIVTRDGALHPVDVVVWCTGFHVTDSYTYVDIKGLGERTWSTDGTARAWRPTAASRCRTCRTCSSCWVRTPRWGTTRWCS